MPTSESNGRVTLALVQQTALQNQEAIRKTHELLEASIKENSKQMAFIESTFARNDERIKNVERDTESLSKRSNVIDGVVAAATAVAAFLGLSR